MKTPNALFGTLVVLLAACSGPDLTEGTSSRVGERYRDAQIPEVGEPCTQDLCVDGQSLRVCGADGTFVWDIDCTVNDGQCRRNGEREECKAVGWDCETRCLDDHTIEICWSDLSVTRLACDSEGEDGQSFEGYVCDPDGAFDPMTGETSAVCTPGAGSNWNEGEGCACDTYESDPANPICCDAGCACDIDCDAGEPECNGSEGSGEAGEGCACDSYESDPANPICCDAGCACDIDCEFGEAECGQDDERGAPDVPAGWSCPAEYYGVGDGCDCECGEPDPDCDDPNQQVYNCQEGQTCDPDGHCA